MKKSFVLWLLPLCMLCMAGSCDSCIMEPTVSTVAKSGVTPTTAISGGDVTSDGGAAVTVRGVCWSTTSSPTIALTTKTTDGTGTGVFSSSITGLNPGVTYYVKAYATNSKGTGYGNEEVLTTLANNPAITTTAVTAITTSSATSGGTINSDGGGAITAKGVCWSTTSGPTIALTTKTTDGTGSAPFASNLSGLTPGTKYYVKAYATNSAGTSYGNEVSFTTSANLPTVITTIASAITASTATSGGNITDDGGSSIIARGVCWSISPGPAIDQKSFTSDGTGKGSYVSSISSLAPANTYYVRAYATNNVGINYGDQITFKTLADIPRTVISVQPYSITSTSAISGGDIYSDYGAPITARGVCWNTTGTPTIADNKTIDGTGIGQFTSTITNLTPVVTYYVRSYATNSAGTGYGSEKTFTTTSTNGIIFNPNLTYGSLTDIDGNIYKTIQIGTQVWMAENLKTARFNDASIIPNVNDNSAWGSLNTPGFCWYNNDVVSNKDVYGALYNWFTANTGKLCPTGWHVPTDGEWTILTTFLGGESVAGGKLKETGTIHWNSSNSGATNETGFTGIPGGYRSQLNGTFWDIKSYGYWWSSTVYNINGAKTLGLGYYYSLVSRTPNIQQNALSVRCLKD